MSRSGKSIETESRYMVNFPHEGDGRGIIAKGYSFFLNVQKLIVGIVICVC
jgi:hypothetical protein